MGATIERVAEPPRRVSLFGLALVILAVAAYGNTFHVPLVLDDAVTLGGQAVPGFASPVAGRPVLAWSFALNRAWGGDELWSYHAVNLAIHIAAGLTLFGVVRRVLIAVAFSRRGRLLPGEVEGPVPSEAEGPTRLASEIAALAAGIWMLHPLLTESVTYLSQRAESLMGLFYLLTLYAHLRGWRFASVVFCWLGMTTKETMVTAPIAVLLLDAALASPFRSGRCEPAGRRSPQSAAARWHAARFLSWGLLAVLMLRSHIAQRGVGFGYGVGSWTYLLTEMGAFAHYLQLAIWPRPLVFDYGFEVLGRFDAWTWLGAILVAGGLIAGFVAWRRCRPVGYLIFLFFLLLAPTSSFVPVALSPIAESRMYLPLAPLAVLAVVGLGRWRRCLLVVPILLGVLTFKRNHTYRSSEALWADTVGKNPRSSRAQNNYGLALADTPSTSGEAIGHYQAALRLNPQYAEAENNLALVLADQPGRAAEAAAHYQAALHLQPNFVEARNNYGTLLARRLNQPDAAIAQFRQALALRPKFAEAHNNLGMTLLGQAGREAEARSEFETALRLEPSYLIARRNLAAAENEEGNAVLRLPGRLTEAVGHYEAALRDDPGLYGAHYNVALAYAELGRFPDALRHMEIAAQLAPSNTEIRDMLARMRRASR